MKAILDWIDHDAKWNEFWLPQSGIVGGYILGCVVGGTIMLILSFF